MDKPVQIQIKYDDTSSKGVHGTETFVTINEKDVCLTFVVPTLTPGEVIVTARVFIPLSTALKLAEIIQQRLGPADSLLKKLKTLIPPSEDSAGQKSETK